MQLVEVLRGPCASHRSWRRRGGMPVGVELDHLHRDAWQCIRPEPGVVARTEAGPTGASERLASGYEPANRRILVVDDNPAIHADFRKILAPAGSSAAVAALEATLFGGDAPRQAIAFELETATQGEEAYEHVCRAHAAGHPYAAAFVDVRMPPGWDGVETVVRLWECDPDLQVVLCTAYSDYTWHEIALRLGATSQFVILKKPFDAIEVRQLAAALTVKWDLLRERRERLELAETLVRERTRELEASNLQLRAEMELRERTEAELLRAQRLEGLTRLVAGLGHELNNPLTYVVANLAFLAEELDAVASLVPATWLAEARELLGETQDGVERIRRSVVTARELAHTESEPTAVTDLVPLLERCARTFGHAIESRARLRLELKPAPPVLGEAARLEQVFLALLANAVQALPCDDSREHSVTIRSLVDTNAAIVEVHDSGEGISPENVPRIFDPFFTTRAVGAARGLGLFLCHAIVRRLGGSIGVESTLGQGTTVRVRLPLASPARGAR